MADDIIRRARVNRSDRLVGPNSLAVDHERIFLAELRADMRERFAHSVLILFVNEIHKGRVFIRITRRRIERSAIAAYFDMPGAVRTLGDEIGWITQQFFLGNVLRKFGAQETFVRSVLEQTTNEIGHAGQKFADRTIFSDPFFFNDAATTDLYTLALHDASCSSA